MNANKKSYLEKPIRAIIGQPEQIEGMEGVFNVAAWKAFGGICLLGRYIEKIDDEQVFGQDKTENGEPIIRGGPDIGSLVLKFMGPDGNILHDRTKEVWRPEPGKNLLEDPRALHLSDGTLVLGLTSVDKYGNPYPAVVVTSAERLMEENQIEPRIMDILSDDDQAIEGNNDGFNLSGKNITAIDKDAFLFRPEGRENHHRLQVFEFNGEVVKHRQYIDLPTDITWGQWRMGTCMSPEWISQNEALILIHGISIIDDKYIYSIGSARLVRGENGMLSIDNVSEDPLLESSHFNNPVQRHQAREAIYSCGWIPKYDSYDKLEHLEIFVNVGDTRTDRVLLDPNEVIKDWQRAELPEFALKY